MTNDLRKAVGERLRDAFVETPARFEALLDACQPGEYPAHWTSGDEISLYATVLAVAAAQNRTEHMRILLNHGWNADSAGFAAEDALGCWGYLESHLTIAEEFGSAPFSMVSWRCDTGIFADPEQNGQSKKAHRLLERVTPLAAAILCGSADAARLLRESGARTVESSAVCAAAVLALRSGSERHRQCVCLAFGMPENTTAEDVLRTQAMPISAYADLCTAEQLCQRLGGAPCTAEDIRTAVQIITDTQLYVTVLEPEDKLLALSEYYPELFREGEMLDALLHMALRGKHINKPPFFLERWKEPEPRLLARWRELAGPERNVTAALSFLSEELLTRLSEGGGTLTMTAERVDFWKPRIQGDNIDERDELLSEVHIVRQTDRGISAFAHSVLKSGRIDLLAAAARSGALRGEPRCELLAFIEEEHLGILPRALALSLPDAPARDAPLPPHMRGEYWTSLWRDVTEEEALSWLSLAWLDPSLSVEECRARIHAIRNDRAFPLFADDYVKQKWLRWTTRALGYESLPIAACCGENANLLQALLEEEPGFLHSLLQSDGADGTLRFTPLAFAASVHAEEQVRLLLALGCDPWERDAPTRSHVYRREEGVTYYSPAELAARNDSDGKSEKILRLLLGN